jgi:predicted Zn finger-like uncharacterized protein
MQLSCPNCGARLFVDDAQVAEQHPTEVKCWMCTQKVSLRDPSAEEGPPTVVLSVSMLGQRARGSRLDDSAAPQTTSLGLPQNQTIRVTVVSGPSEGLEAELLRPLETIGRLGGGADIEIDDAEVSRVHCAIEVREGAILLHDLSSTNGTFIGESRVLAARLEHLSTFRIGATVLQVSVVPSV